METTKRQWRFLAVIGPGLLVAATGVGAGDLATAGFAGSQLGVAVLWAVVIGAFFKYVLTEGLARWQLATGTTLLEGVLDKFGLAAAWIFLPYLFLWSFFVGSALISACGVTMHAILPIYEDASLAKIFFGAVQSILGVILVLAGGFRLFEKIMSACIAVMFVTVIVTAWMLAPGLGEVLRGLLIPHPSTLQGSGLSWTVALMGGVGGTLTVLCYGYWIQEKGREGGGDMKVCRIDLGVGYIMTALFGIAMVIIGSQVAVEGKGAMLIVQIAARLEERLGIAGKWMFLIGAWGAVFSSLLGVWQSVPYIFTDFYNHMKRRHSTGKVPAERVPVHSSSLPYRIYLFAIAFVPMMGLFYSFKEIQKLYAIIGAFFMPFLALTLLVLNGRRVWVGALRNRRATFACLLFILIFFGWIFVKTVAKQF